MIRRQAKALKNALAVVAGFPVFGNPNLRGHKLFDIIFEVCPVQICFEEECPEK
jgi:hypothetical protein